jgi:hypothetical protein
MEPIPKMTDDEHITAFGADQALTIYNQNFAVVRERIPLELKAGVNEVKFADISVHLEPESVILRAPSGKTRYAPYS